MRLAVCLLLATFAILVIACGGGKQADQPVAVPKVGDMVATQRPKGYTGPMVAFDGPQYFDGQGADIPLEKALGHARAADEGTKVKILEIGDVFCKVEFEDGGKWFVSRGDVGLPYIEPPSQREIRSDEIYKPGEVVEVISRRLTKPEVISRVVYGYLDLDKEKAAKDGDIRTLTPGTKVRIDEARQFNCLVTVLDGPHEHFRGILADSHLGGVDRRAKIREGEKAGKK